MSMKIERSSLDQVRQRFEANKKKREEKKKEYDIEERLKEIKEEVSVLVIIMTVCINMLFMLYILCCAGNNE